MSSLYLISVPLTNNLRNSAFYAAWETNSAIRFGAAGLLGNAVFFGLDKMLLPTVVRAASTLSVSDRSAVIISWSRWTKDNAASVSFFLAYLLDIALQHFLNAWLVFGLETISTRELYFNSLATTYTAYFGTLCGSTILQAYLLQRGLSKSVAFWTTIGLGAFVNYFVLNFLNAASEKTDKSSTTYNNPGGTDTHCSTGGNKGEMAMVPLW
eukprot:CAMPEP_0172535824 /NCGR_PEP_ID=MMETSP1067-20121228/7662_1 /TAXON_ID=265564 ORGANISM="Thalassiosira punctigera, Strain Tpunct2005C2" /NCGR_SAMPLE_ID=MMETSP1067 /ASSEMBLY_ACC=CAM_ASM_000444 /LENGTH=210 /DNA_ID=CAMNT_0013320779 /DNA_START=80 /DNA_END=709 /DNA_ORIENTATION=+